MLSLSAKCTGLHSNLSSLSCTSSYTGGRDVTGTLPKRLTQLMRLESLFGGTHAHYFYLFLLHSTSSLYIICTDNNELEGSIPSEIANLKQIKEISLSKYFHVIIISYEPNLHLTQAVTPVRW